MRNNEWLENRMEFVQRKHFADINILNTLTIRFGRRAKTRLGSIKKVYPKSLIEKLAGKFETEILITGYFRDEKVPKYVIDATIGHELCHYAHGFSSPLPQLANHPHRGGIVSKELAKRGLGALEKKQKIWIKKNWQKFIRDILKEKI